ncbi:MAG: hypothetical protein KDA28_01275, partial [Phycisphaerales bacterium]|nr:hypothetical protein [Phycisphaerales bacterium]
MRALLAMLTASVAAADVWYVDAGAPAGGDGTTWASAFHDLQDALAIASPLDEVWIARGRYLPSTDGDPGATFQ